MQNQDNYLNSLEEIEILIAEKKFSAAIFICKKIIEEEVYNEIDEIYLILSRAYFGLKRYDDAHIYFSKIDNVILKNNKYYFLQGQIYEKLEKFDMAEKGFFIAVRKIPKNRKYLKKYIDFVYKYNFVELAIKKLGKLSISKPEKNFFVNIEISKYYIRKKYLKEAFLILNRLKPYNEIEENLLNEVYALIYESFNDYENAFNRLKKINSPDIFQSLKIDEISYLCQNKKFFNVLNFYNMEFVEKNSILTIVFSSIENKFILKGYNFNSSVLFLSEKIMTYYTYQYKELVIYLANFIKEKKIEKVNLVGSSKGAFAAINISLGLENILSSEIRVIAFSPQSYIYPLNKNIEGLPSYKLLLKNSKKYILMKNDLSCFGNPIEKLENSKLDIKIIYGGLHIRDSKEAKNFSIFSNITLTPIDNYPFHTSMLIYTKKEEKLKIALTRKIDSRSKDDQFFRPQDNEKLIKNIIDKVCNYNFELNEVLLN